MQSGKIGTEYKYDMADAKFKTAFSFLARKDLADMPEGWIELENGVRASVQHYTTMPANELAFETHERFFDIQYMVEGEELVGYVNRARLREKVAYAVADDVTLYKDPPVFSAVLLCAGDYAVLAPEDAHKPRCIAGNAMAIKKVVIKVPVSCGEEHAGLA